MSFDNIRALADAVLLEGYALYPYRSSAAKNQFRWTFGVLAPREWSEAGGCERWWLRMQCLVHGSEASAISGRLRFLQLVRRRVEASQNGELIEVDRLDAGEQLVLPWDEGKVTEVALSASLGQTGHAAGVELDCAVAGGLETEPIRADDGALVGRIVRQRWPISGRVCVRSHSMGNRLHRLEILVENLTPWRHDGAPRNDALRAAMLSTHLLLRVHRGEFVSLIDPPSWAEAVAAECQNEGTYPVLAGQQGHRHLILSAPIVLYDHPQLAPESPGNFYDATEIDALLSLRTTTLTEGEKREVRATDARTAALLERVDSMPPEVMERLHGAVRELSVIAPRAELRFEPGDRVRLLAPRGRTDAQDALLVGCTATVERTLQDVDGESYLAVTIDEDPAAELHRWYGRFHYYRPDEVELVSRAQPTAAAETSE